MTDPASWETFLYKDPGLKKGEGNDAMGYGMERCLYELNPKLACLSPCLIHACVLTPAQALTALEDVAAQPNRPSFPVDRHLAAFLMSRWKEMSFMDLRDMSKPQREIKNLAVLKILAGIQNHFKIEGLPNLCQWMAQICAPIVTHYHNLKARAQVQDDIEKAVGTGQLMKLVRALENRQAMKDDEGDYQAAKIEVLLIESEIKEIELRILNRNHARSRYEKGILNSVSSLFSWFKHARQTRRNKMRMEQLYQKSEDLRETWGEGLLPRGKHTPQDFWGKLRKKMNASTRSNRPYKTTLRYD
jgi:hypothetical protein